jgi:hypothetical protein
LKTDSAERGKATLRVAWRAEFPTNGKWQTIELFFDDFKPAPGRYCRRVSLIEIAEKKYKETRQILTTKF